MSKRITQEIPNVTDRDRKIVEWRRRGYTYRQIGDALGMTANGVMKALRRIEDGRPGRGSRAAAKLPDAICDCLDCCG